VTVRTVVMTQGFIPDCFPEMVVSFGVDILRNLNGVWNLISCPLTSKCAYVTLLLSCCSHPNKFTLYTTHYTTGWTTSKSLSSYWHNESAIVYRNGRTAMNSSFCNTAFCVFISFFTCICRSVAGYRMTDYTYERSERRFGTNKRI
jgi:hypothetical protein